MAKKRAKKKPVARKKPMKKARAVKKPVKMALTAVKKAKGPVNFISGMTYPWGRAKGLLNIFWALIPILGWLALMGYGKKIIQELVKGNTNSLPVFGGFWENLEKGFWVFVLLIPLYVVVTVLGWIPLLGRLIVPVIAIFFIPYLVINFMVKGQFAATLEIKKAASEVFKNLGEYVVAFLKTIAFGIVYGLLCFVLIGIPCLSFGQYFYLADFYRKHS
ncbi:MAG: DUF4013 domain-containing protein [Candidatus Woesearchaeota archaeon]